MRIIDIKLAGLKEEQKKVEYTLYLVRCFNEDEEFLKFGFTRNRKVNNRFDLDFPYNFEIVTTLKIKNTETIENMFHAMFFHKRYLPSIKFSGYTECYPTHFLEYILCFLDGLKSNTFLTEGTIPKLSTKKVTFVKSEDKKLLNIQKYPANDESSTRPGAFVLFNRKNRVRIDSSPINCFNDIKELKKTINFTHYAVINGDCSTKTLRNKLEQELRTNYDSLTMLDEEQDQKSVLTGIHLPENSNKSKKHYVVFKGREIGIFEHWDECKASTVKFKGAKFKSYNNYDKAVDAFVRFSKKSQPKKTFNRITPKNQISAKPTSGFAVDASCLGNPGLMEYQCKDINNGKVIFNKTQFYNSTNNIGEFLAIVDILRYSNSNKDYRDVYTDSRTAMSWIKKRKVKTSLKPSPSNEKTFNEIKLAEKWLDNNNIKNRILKWHTSEWGEIPADFGRK